MAHDTHDGEENQRIHPSYHHTPKWAITVPSKLKGKGGADKPTAVVLP